MWDFSRRGNKAKDLGWIEKYQHFTVDDECANVRRQTGERRIQQGIKPIVKHGGGNIQVFT